MILRCFEFKDHNVWALLNLMMGSLAVPQESLFMFYLYLIDSRETSLNLKKAWAFSQVNKLKRMSEKGQK